MALFAFGVDDAGLGGSRLLLRLDRRLALLTRNEAMSEDSVRLVFMAAFVESIDKGMHEIGRHVGLVGKRLHHVGTLRCTPSHLAHGLVQAEVESRVGRLCK